MGRSTSGLGWAVRLCLRAKKVKGRDAAVAFFLISIVLLITYDNAELIFWHLLSKMSKFLFRHRIMGFLNDGLLN